MDLRTGEYRIGEVLSRRHQSEAVRPPTKGRLSSPTGVGAAFLHRVTLLSILLVGCATMRLDAQEGRRPPRGRGAHRVDASTPTSSAALVAVEPAAPIANLFSRAEEGIARADWKFAIDCLQRIIDDPQGSLVVRQVSDADGVTRFESARRQATRRLASLPAEGVRAYQLLFDGKAKRLLEQGYSNRDPRPLREVVDRYLLTRYGDEAAELLASWALDGGQPGLAVTMLTGLLDLAPDAAPPRPGLSAKLAAAYALLGRSEEATAIVEASLDKGDTGSDDEHGRFLRSVLALRPELADPRTEPDSWPLLGGNAARRGRMPAVEPTLLETIPWRCELPGAASNAWRRVLQDDPAESLTLPVGRLVSDGQRVFARTRKGCAAFSMEDLAPEWEFRVPGRVARQAPQSQQRSGRTQEPTVTDVGFAFEDHVVGEVALTDGLVMLLSHEGRGRYTLSGRDAGQRRFLSWLPRALVGAGAIRGTQLIALDAATGRIRWQRGRTGHPDDPLGGVEFRSTPITVDGALWVPFVRQADLYVGVLNPADGALINSILLCSVKQPVTSPKHALHLAASDGMVFVPSGTGLLFAVDVHDYTPRWATHFSPALPEPMTGDGGWAERPRSATPVVAGGLVVLIPTEHDQVLAFSSITGELKWSADCGEGGYLTAVDHKRVWVAGRTIACLSLATGQQFWATTVEPALTGHAVVADEFVYVPTIDGLLSLQASTGALLGSVGAPSSSGALGNLLCVGSAMFALNPSSIQKFPDIGRTYALTRTAYEADPEELTIAVRLAWLELLRGEPRRAFDVLEAIPPAIRERDAGSADRVAHARVEALLAMAHQSAARDQANEEVLQWLLHADRAARNAADRFRCSLAIGDQLGALGRHADAFRHLWDVGVGADGEQIVPWGDHVRGPARYAIAMRLHTIAERLTETQQRQLVDYATSRTHMAANRIGEAVHAPDDHTQLQALTELRVLSPVYQRAFLELAMFHARGLRYEQAEQLLRDSVRLEANDRLATIGHMALTRLYADAVAGGHESVSVLDSALDVLSSRFGVSAVPDAVAADAWLIRVPGPVGSVGEWAGAVRSSLSATVRAADSKLEGGEIPVQLIGELAWSIDPEPRNDVPRLVSFGHRSPGVLSDRLVIQGPADELTCYRADSGEVVWKTSLRLPDTVPDEESTNQRQSDDSPPWAVADGQTAVFHGRDGLFAVGLGTGRRIWCRGFEPAGSRRSPSATSSPMAADLGLLAATPRAGWLTLLRLLDGKVIWERDLLGERVGYLWMPADRVITADPRLERVHLFNRADGRLIKRVLFKQPDPRNLLVNLVPVGDVLCGPVARSEFKGIAGVDLASGEIQWEMKVDKPVVQLFSPQDGYLGVGLLGGDVRIVEASTGEPLIVRRVTGAQAVVRGTLTDGTLVVQQHDIETGVRAVSMTGLDVATDTELWHRDDVIPLWRMDRALRVVGGRIPVLYRPDRQGGGRSNRLRLTMIDVRTGTVSGQEVFLQTANPQTRLNGDFELLPASGVAVVGTNAGIRALRTEVVSDSSPRDF